MCVFVCILQTRAAVRNTQQAYVDTHRKSTHSLSIRVGYVKVAPLSLWAWSGRLGGGTEQSEREERVTDWKWKSREEIERTKKSERKTDDKRNNRTLMLLIPRFCSLFKLIQTPFTKKKKSFYSKSLLLKLLCLFCLLWFSTVHWLQHDSHRIYA